MFKGGNRRFGWGYGLEEAWHCFVRAWERERVQVKSTGIDMIIVQSGNRRGRGWDEGGERI